LVLSVLWPTPNPPSAAPPPFQTTESIGPGQSKEWTVDFSQSGEVLEGWAQIPQFDLVESDRIRLELASEGQRSVTKELNAGDPSLLVPIGIANSAVVRITAKSSSERELPLEVRVRALPISNEEIFAFETEPNNSWREANPMKIGRTVYGNNDETDYLDNKDENPQKGFANGLDNPRRDRPGLDWFRIDVEEEKPFLVLFELDVLDRDVSVNLRTYVTDASGENLELFMEGSDPMEIVHDREPERYSKAISRILKKGTYYLQVNGNHPRYTLRSKVYGVPPFDNAEDAVKLGAHYIMNVGDAWVAQVPREGNIYRRVENLHDSTLRCTACHPSIFSTEAVLTSVKAGYPIEAKSQFRYVVDRIYNGPTPLYGPFDANWQRYIAIPMQSQGKHGMILKDFEKYVSQKETPFFERYAPFLRHAWTGMEELHPDEANGVVPADSNVGFAIRDWIVMKEAERRSGDRSFGEAAANVEGLISSASCNLKNIQDKIHRVWAFSVMGENPDHYADERNKGIEEILSFQNEDGGWPDIVEPGRPSAVYTTGQVIWTLTQAGHTLESLPQLQKAADYLLGEQKVFGGWYQTSTHENFRTPMRETRYAVMGLAATHPLEGAPHKGWGNRDGGEGRLPAEGSSLLQTLDALDNLWEVPSGREEEFTQALISLLNSEEPSIRSTAAETLGRVGTESAFEPLVALLDDPIKDVWRSAAWALRQFGDAGYGHDRIKELLSDANPAMRRGALRIFAYHYFGIDHRLDIAKEIMKLTEDENFWTRLAAYKTLRQWFYRSGDNAFKREIVDLYIDRMAAPDHSAIRTNLAQGMYIMLDENQAGGVSLERNIARFPYERDRETVLAARKHVEQSVLLEPVLEALYSGNALQREALLASFDGSFFRGRFYARNPRNMIDVGNDREFSFYYQPPQQVLDRLFESLLYDESLSDKSLEQAARLASFFYVYRDTPNTRIQSRLLALTRHGAEPVRLAAREFVAKDLAFKGAEEDRRLTNQIEKLLESGDAGLQETVLTAARRNDAIVHNEQIVARIESYLEDEGAWDLLLPVIDTDVLSDSQAIEVLLTLWGRSEDENRRLEVLDRFFARKEMVDQEDPSAEVVRLLKRASGDEVVAIREALLKHLEESEKLRHSGRIAQVLHSGLADPSAGIRLKSLALAQDQERFWTSADTIEYVLKLLVDPDPKIRELALASVEKFDLLSNEPRFAKRVKPLVDDEVLGATATALLVAHGFNPDEIEGDGAIQSYGIPDLEFFREKINPIFYTVGHDNHSCYECHQNHNILRISEIPEEGEEFPEELVIQNFNSALKVVNLGDPEQSLILRKPRSPEGQGGEDADSPTGLTHVGGPRWDSKTHPAYQTMLEWIQDAAASQERRVGVSVATDSFSPDYPPEKALDNDPQTIWHTEFVGAMPGYPHEIVIDLGETLNTSAFQYVPRQDSGNGRVKEWELYTSADRENWGEAVASGTWENDAAVKTVPLRAEGIRYVRFKGLSSVDDQPFMSAAEVIVLRAKEEGPAPGS
jgi:hypothetical protein